MTPYTTGYSTTEGVQDAEIPKTLKRKRTGVRNACDPCRARKVGCDGIRPVCGSCKTGQRQCAWETRGEDETRRVALRRENESLKTELSELKEAFELFKSMSATDVLQFRRHAVLSTGSFKEAVAAFQKQRVERQAVPSSYQAACSVLPTMKSQTELELTMRHPKAYPVLNPYSDPATFAATILRPARITTCDSSNTSSGKCYLGNFNPSSREQQLISTDASYGLKSWKYITLCDDRLKDIEIKYWTVVPISNEFAASIISQYLEVDHPTLGFF